MCLQLFKELVSLFGCIAHSEHFLSLFLVDDILLAVTARDYRAVLVKVGSELFFNLVLNITETEYIVLALTGSELNFYVM